MILKPKKIDEILTEIYVESYKNSTPSGDFNELVKNASLNEHGQKEIPFMNYELEEEMQDMIIESVLKKHKVKEDYYKRAIRTSIILGCSPKTKLKKEFAVSAEIE